MLNKVNHQISNPKGSSAHKMFSVWIEVHKSAGGIENCRSICIPWRELPSLSPSDYSLGLLDFLFFAGVPCEDCCFWSMSLERLYADRTAGCDCDYCGVDCPAIACRAAGTRSGSSNTMQKQSETTWAGHLQLRGLVFAISFVRARNEYGDSQSAGFSRLDLFADPAGDQSSESLQPNRFFLSLYEQCQ